MAALNLDFIFSPVISTVAEVVRCCDEVLSSLGARRAVLLQRVTDDGECIDVDPLPHARARSLDEAEQIASSWVGRQHLYRLPTFNTDADILLCVWTSPGLGCTVVISVERADMRRLQGGGDPFVTIGSMCTTLSRALGASWGLMRIDEDLTVLSDDDFRRSLSAVQRGLGDPAFLWLNTEAFARSSHGRLRHEAFEVLETADGYHIVTHKPTITWLRKNF